MNSLKTFVLLFLYSFVLNATCHAIETTDSIAALLQKAKHDTIKIRLLSELIEHEGDDNIWPAYNTQMKELSEKLISVSKDKAVIIAAKKGLADALNNEGYLFIIKGEIEKAIQKLNQSVSLQEETKNYKNLAATLNNIGSLYDNQGNISLALNYYEKSAKIRERINDREGMAQSYVNMGVLYDNQGDVKKALEYYTKGLVKFTILNKKEGMAKCYNNIGYIYYNQNKHSLAIDYMYKSLSIRLKENDIAGLAESYNNIGMIYYSLDSNKISLEYIEKSVEYYNKSGNAKGIAYAYSNMGTLYFKMGQLEKAKFYGEKSYKLSKEIGFPSNIEKVTFLLRNIYEKENNFKQAYIFYKEEMLMRDSTQNKENYKKTQKQQARFEYEKKAATDSLAHIKAIEIKNLEMKKQKMVNWFFVIGLIVLSVIAIFIYRSLKITRSQKRIIEEKNILVEQKNEILNSQNEEIRAQRDEIESQRNEIASQRDLVMEQKQKIEHIYRAISDSINYARRIQQAVLPASEYADKILGEHFILFKPKDVISGDFYWCTQINNHLIITVADCTGHGVPGAFMSMLGVSFLNEIVRKKEITKTSEVLDNLRKSIIDALNQKGTSGEQKDGMDIAICALNIETNVLQFSGANNPLFIVNANNELIEIQPDKQPVAIYESMKPFTNHEIQMLPGECIYLTSDGFADQFGGPRNKKFMIKKLKELLVSNAKNQMQEQLRNLNSTFENWRGLNEQVDDVTVLGKRI